MTFDLLFFRGRIHGDALTKVDVMIDFFDFIAVDSTGYVLSELVVHSLGLFLVHTKPNFKASLVEVV